MKTQKNRSTNAANTNVVGYDFSITGTTRSGQKLTATIPAGTPRKQIAMLFETIGYPVFLNTMEHERT